MKFQGKSGKALDTVQIRKDLEIHSKVQMPLNHGVSCAHTMILDLIDALENPIGRGPHE
jgi:hypothetical protein